MEDRSLPGPPNWFVNSKSVKELIVMCLDHKPMLMEHLV